MENKPVLVDSEDLRIMLLSMFNYSINRRTYLSEEIRSYFKKYHSVALSHYDLNDIAAQITGHLLVYGRENRDREWSDFEAWCRHTAATRRHAEDKGGSGE